VHNCCAEPFLLPLYNLAPASFAANACEARVGAQAHDVVAEWRIGGRGHLHAEGAAAAAAHREGGRERGVPREVECRQPAGEH
jgi:hypothetical protein